MSKHAFKVGDRVRIGSGQIEWKITGFFGEHSDIASLQRPDLPSSNTSARFERLALVNPGLGR